MLNHKRNQGFYGKFGILPWMVISILFARICVDLLRNWPTPKAIAPAGEIHGRIANDAASSDSSEVLPDEDAPSLPEMTSDSEHGAHSARGEHVVSSNDANDNRSFIVQNQVIRDLHGQVVHRGAVDLTPTLDRIRRGELDRHHHDGTEFQNREARLPGKPAGYYKEYVHPTPRISGPGPQRVILGRDGEIWYTPDHYRTFIEVKPQKITTK